MIITIFIHIPTRVNPARDLDLNQRFDLCPRSTTKLSFKTIIITIFILTCLSLIILKLRFSYKDILRIKNIVSKDMLSMCLLF